MELVTKRDIPNEQSTRSADASAVEDRGGELAGYNKGDEPRPRR